MIVKALGHSKNLADLIDWCSTKLENLAGPCQEPTLYRLCEMGGLM
jgi:hypothetical protein